MKALIVRIGAMGDVLHALPAVAALKRAHPDWRVDWAVEPRWGEMLVDGAVVDGVVAVRTRDWNRRPLSLATARDVWGLRRRLRGERYDVCVDLQGTMRSAVVGWMAGARRFVGPAEPREGPAMHLYGETVQTGAVHVVDQAFEIVERVTGELAGGSAERWMIPVDAAAERWAEELAGGRRIVVIAPTTGWRSKEWPVARFGELAVLLRTDGWTVLVNAGPEGAETAEAMVEASGGGAKIVLCSIAELASLLRRASLFIGGDTGPMHLADGLGVPVVALFGPTDPARNGPRGKRVRVLRNPSSVTDHGRYRETEGGLKRITVEEVYRAAMDLLETPGRLPDEERG